LILAERCPPHHWHITPARGPWSAGYCLPMVSFIGCVTEPTTGVAEPVTRRGDVSVGFIKGMPMNTMGAPMPLKVIAYGRTNFKILRAVIGFVAVQMMNSLFWQQRSPEHLLGYQAVLKNVARTRLCRRMPFLSHEDIPTSMDSPSTFPVGGMAPFPIWEFRGVTFRPKTFEARSRLSFLWNTT